MINLIIIIDNKFYEKSLKRKGIYYYYKRRLFKKN